MTELNQDVGARQKVTVFLSSCNKMQKLYKGTSYSVWTWTWTWMLH